MIGLAISQLSGVGGISIIGLGLGILEIKRIRITNMLPSLAVALALLFGV